MERKSYDQLAKETMEDIRATWHQRDAIGSLLNAIAKLNHDRECLNFADIKFSINNAMNHINQLEGNN